MDFIPRLFYAICGGAVLGAVAVAVLAAGAAAVLAAGAVVVLAAVAAAVLAAAGAVVGVWVVLGCIAASTEKTNSPDCYCE